MNNKLFAQRSLNLVKLPPQRMARTTEADKTLFHRSKKGSRHLRHSARKRGGVAAQRGRKRVCLLATLAQSMTTANFVMPTFDASQLETLLKSRLASGLLLCSDGLMLLQKKLLKRDSKFRDMTSTLTEGLLTVDMEGYITSFNPAAMTLLGMQSEDILGKFAHDLFHHSHIDKSSYAVGECPIHQFLKSDKGAVCLEEDFWRKNGTSFPVSVVSSALFRGDERCGAVISFRDISAHRAAVDEERKSKKRLELALKWSNTGSWLIDLPGHSASCTQEFNQIFGYEALPGPWTYEQFLDHVLPEDRMEVDRRFQIAVTTHSEWEFECRIRRVDSIVRWIWGCGGHLYNQDDQKQGLAGIIMDISRRKEAEMEFRHAKELAEKVSIEKDEFLSSMSHELRTPMNVVLGLTEVLLETDLSSNQRDLVQTMDSSGKVLLSIINDILDFSRIEAGRLQVNEAPFSPNVVVTETTDLMLVIAKEKGITLSSNVLADVPDTLLGDEHRLKQVLINLIGNAMKFTHQGRIETRLAIHPDEPENLLFSVTDTGIGIAPEHIDRIFKRFNQADSEITRQYGGTGLGLAISKRLVELMGGRIWVKSMLGQGSTFYFTLPTHDGKLQAIQSASLDLHKDDSGRILRILLAEDTLENQIVIKAFLKGTAHHLVIVDDGFEALNRVKEECFDLLLTDIEMPNLDGYTVTKTIRNWERQEGRRPLVILALSAHSSSKKRDRSMAAGCDDHLTKPLRKRTLLDAIQKVAKSIDIQDLTSSFNSVPFKGETSFTEPSYP